MDFAYSLGSPNATPLIKKYQVAQTLANPGVPVLEPAANGAGVVIATTTGAANMVGVCQDTATYTTTQGSGTSSAERKVSVIINPDAVYKCKLSGGATENTALTLQTTTSASSGGTAVTTGAEWSSPTYDEGVTWGYSGANVGQIRKVTSVSSTAGTVTTPFDFAIAVGDVFLRAPYWFLQGETVQLTTNLYQADASIAVGTGAALKIIDMELRDLAGQGTVNSYIHIISDDHALRETT